MSSNATVLEGGTTTIGCYGFDYFVIAWKFKGLMVNDGPRLTLRDDNVTISQVIRPDSGAYECIVGNEMYSVSENATLTVECRSCLAINNLSFKIYFICVCD